MEVALVPKQGRLRKIAVWILSLPLALLSFANGASKVGGAEIQVANFARWGYPDWARIFIGVVEVACGVFLVIPRCAFVGAVLLGLVMVAAIYTHLSRGEDEAGMAWFNLVLLLLCGVIAHIRRQSGTGIRAHSPPVSNRRGESLSGDRKC
jgi:uncharacterized membrane protein YphA (DoxX/SURF4 family)